MRVRLQAGVSLHTSSSKYARCVLLIFLIAGLDGLFLCRMSKGFLFCTYFPAACRFQRQPKGREREKGEIEEEKEREALGQRPECDDKHVGANIEIFQLSDGFYYLHSFAVVCVMKHSFTVHLLI